ncbi:MAG: NADPH:quinone reductase [Nitrospinaceae bacterium]|jgi:NADPH:quinone reductase|nr:NADPH:quinone reductase [Nitrospinaceae bacterium]MBT3433708.1 NADPH:quinone reductase [Nitrospinaceae bacterium]MBT3822594.1 NADPH:quinone reductase [Nitrospinaceae bacterium]MBT4430323.1 NADPH:quinone reductase [Nitrospinaceae bacterium]MBT5368599.1 NADPH:quinone reductase [Nitrospinaceae bacterium]
MKAVSVHQLGMEHPLVVEDLPDPVAGAGQILVCVHAAGVNPLEISIRSGDNPRARQMKLPIICGTDVAGEVEAVGEGVEKFQPGDRVWGRSTTGGYAEKGVLAAGSTGHLPDRMSYGEGACLPIPMLTAWNALVIKTKAQPGESVLVQGGAGGVGHLAIQLARQMGCHVFATVSSTEKGDFCRAAGAEVVINYRDEDVAERVKEMTGGRGVDVVVENSAKDNLPGDLRLIALNGRIVIVGPGTGKEGDVTISVRPIMGADGHIMGLSSGNLAPQVPTILRRLGPILARGDIKPHVGKEFTFAQADEAHRLVLSGKFLGKVVLMA